MQPRNIGLILSAISAIVGLFGVLDRPKGQAITKWGYVRITLCSIGFVGGVLAFIFFPSDPVPRPLLAIGTPPYFYKVRKDTLTVNWTVMNIGNTVADNLKELELEIDVNPKAHTVRIINSTILSALPNYTQFYAGGTIGMTHDFKPGFLATDSFPVFYQRIAYKDSLGHRPDTFRKFFPVRRPVEGATITDLDPDLYSEIQNYLKNRHYW